MNLVCILFICTVIMAGDKWSNPFSKENAIALKGICTVFIIFRHLLPIFEDTGIVGILF